MHLLLFNISWLKRWNTVKRNKFYICNYLCIIIKYYIKNLKDGSIWAVFFSCMDFWLATATVVATTATTIVSSVVTAAAEQEDEDNNPSTTTKAIITHNQDLLICLSSHTMRKCGSVLQKIQNKYLLTFPDFPIIIKSKKVKVFWKGDF